MEIVAKIFNCNYATYKKFYKDAIKRAYKKDNVDIDPTKLRFRLKNYQVPLYKLKDLLINIIEQYLFLRMIN